MLLSVFTHSYHSSISLHWNHKGLHVPLKVYLISASKYISTFIRLQPPSCISKFTSSLPPCVALNSVYLSVQMQSLDSIHYGLKQIYQFTELLTPCAFLNSPDRCLPAISLRSYMSGLQVNLSVGSIMAFKFFSEFTPLWPSNVLSKFAQ